MEYETLNKIFYKDKANYENIYNSRISSEDAIVFDIDIKSNPAFVLQCREVSELISYILRKDKEIALLKGKLPEMALRHFKYRTMVDEIVVTNEIEGVYSSRKEINEVASALDLKNGPRRFEGIVRQYELLGEMEKRITSCGNIREIYDELVLNEIADEDTANIPDGQIFRKEMVSVVKGGGKTVHNGLYPEKVIIDSMNKALKILNNDATEPLIRIAVFHYLFGYIHPFYDGNGRIARFISSRYLSEELDSLIGIRFSYAIREELNEYYRAFDVCNDEKNKGDLTPFAIMFLKVVSEAEDSLIEGLKTRKHYYDKYLEVLSNYDGLKDYKLLEICNVLLQGSLFSEHGLTQREIRNELGISSPQTLSSRFKELKGLGLLKESDEKYGNIRFYSLNLDKLSGEN